MLCALAICLVMTPMETRHALDASFTFISSSQSSNTILLGNSDVLALYDKSYKQIWLSKHTGNATAISHKKGCVAAAHKNQDNTASIYVYSEADGKSISSVALPKGCIVNKLLHADNDTNVIALVDDGNANFECRIYKLDRDLGLVLEKAIPDIISISNTSNNQIVAIDITGSFQIYTIRPIMECDSLSFTKPLKMASVYNNDAIMYADGKLSVFSIDKTNKVDRQKRVDIDKTGEVHILMYNVMVRKTDSDAHYNISKLQNGAIIDIGKVNSKPDIWSVCVSEQGVNVLGEKMIHVFPLLNQK